MSEFFKSAADYDDDRLDRKIWATQRATGWSRRKVIQTLFGAAVGGAALHALPGRAYGANYPGGVAKDVSVNFFTRGTNFESRFANFKGLGYLTPVSHFFIRNHTQTPIIDGATWSLSVEGPGVTTPTTFTLAQLQALPAVTLTRAVECAGNGRSFFNPPSDPALVTNRPTPTSTAAGTAWIYGAVGVSAWTGVRLSTLLNAAGVLTSGPGAAVDVLPEGLDDNFGTFGKVRRPIPISRALEDDVLVVYGQNGAALAPDHGFPARLLVPGWVGIANIKWLGKITVSNAPLAGTGINWFDTQYRFTGNIIDYPTDQPGGPRLSTQNVKSAFELPSPATLTRGVNLITGRSWSAKGSIAQVEVSFNDGITWRRAVLKQGGNGHQAWAEWQIPWVVTAPGVYQIRARAVDNQGNSPASQPAASSAALAASSRSVRVAFGSAFPPAGNFNELGRGASRPPGSLGKIVPAAKFSASGIAGGR